jgi:hypothetical protein
LTYGFDAFPMHVGFSRADARQVATWHGKSRQVATGTDRHAFANGYIDFAINTEEKPMSIDEQINHAKELIAKREEIDRQLAELFSGVAPERSAKRCKTCGGLGHIAKTCPTRMEAKTAEPNDTE